MVLKESQHGIFNKLIRGKLKKSHKPIYLHVGLVTAKAHAKICLSKHEATFNEECSLTRSISPQPMILLKIITNYLYLLHSAQI